MSNKIILDLCGGSGAWSKPYKDAGYDVRLITLPEHDVMTYEPPKNVYGILSAPPCTEFSIAKDHKLPKDWNGAMKVVDRCLNIIQEVDPVFWAMENPSGFLSKFLGKSQYSFQPYEFGDAWCKRTHIWGRFTKPIKTHTWEECVKIPELYIRPGRGKPSIAFCHKSHKKYMPSIKYFPASTDAEFRAITPQGFAKAFYRENK